MPRFFSEKPENGQIKLKEGDMRHAVKSLRLRKGDMVTVCDGEGTDYECEVESVSGGELTLNVKSERESDSEPGQEVTLFMAVPKSDKLELIVQKTVELGVSAIVPFISKNCVPRIENIKKKLERWNRISIEAAGQCGRGRIPKVFEPVTFSEAVLEASKKETALFLNERERKTGVHEVLSRGIGATVSVVTGPEGGFDILEAEQALEMGLESVSLGPRVLRCETAPIAVMALIMYESGNMGF